MGYPIYHSAYTAAQIEAAIGKGPRVNSSGYWEVWNVSTMTYESTGVGAGVTPPTVVTQVSQMTNHAYVYIYNGTETGYTAGYWYYWDGSAWTAGGAYQVAATDPTLSVAGAAADAEVTGKTIRQDESIIMGEPSTLTFEYGGIRVDGSLVSNYTRMRSVDYIPYDANSFIVNFTQDFPFAAKGYVVLYDSAYNAISYTASNNDLAVRVLPLSVYSSYNPAYFKFNLAITPATSIITNDYFNKIAARMQVLNPSASFMKQYFDGAFGPAFDSKADSNGVYEFRGFINNLGYTALSQCNKPGYYGCAGGYITNISDLPSSYDGGAFLLEVETPAFGDVTYPYIVQKLYRTTFKTYVRVIQTNGTLLRDWFVLSDGYSPLYGKKVAIIGDSISTNGDYDPSTNPLGNVPEIVVEQADVTAGVTLSAYLTYYDLHTKSGSSWVEAPLTIGGVTYTAANEGDLISFVPTADDIGKMVGKPLSYNPASTIVWWEVMKDYFGFDPIPVCWSGASISSHEGNSAKYKTSYAWHDAQISKCGVRTPGTMNRTAPDVVIIYRGTNDMTHSPYARLTAEYFDNYNWQYPDNDIVDTNKYGYKEALCLTIKKLRNTYPNAKIILCTLNVFKRVNYSHFPTNNGINSLPQYNDAIREVADFMGCGVIDFDKDGITFENCYSEGYITDSATTPTHPSNKGHEAMGRKAIVDVNAQYSRLT